MGMNSAPIPATIAFCTECGRPYPPDDLVRFGNNLVCAECKPRFVQRMREGVAGPSTMVYGGFWRRFLAVLIDSIFVAIVNFPVQMMLGLASFRSIRTTEPNFGLLGLIYLISFVIQCAYFTYFWSQRGATPGQMILGLKVVTAEVGPLTVGRAFGRYWAYMLSAFTLCIGYIIAAFDSQKRALHDYICGTRVIRTTL
jgi:uncharacterized RDD family membrane protein YckC